MPLKAVVKGNLNEKKDLTENPNFSLVHLVSTPQDQLKNRLREAIGKNLADPLRIPEVIEGLVEYLLEVFPNDPGKTKLWGV
jgi:hypothetical protein